MKDIFFGVTKIENLFPNLSPKNASYPPRVLLVEAGGPSQWLNGVPATAPYWMGSDYDWKYAFEPSDKVSLAMEDRVVKKPRGKVLGGSSMLNWMVHVRGHPGDYDEWEKLGNKGWSYK